MFTLTYPQSRIKSSGQCNKCRGTIGNFVNRGLVKLQNADGTELSLMRWTCNYCGYTMLFDIETAKNARYDGSETEDFS